jgi:glutamine amidotransferase-like uncharacterized protein
VSRDFHHIKKSSTDNRRLLSMRLLTATMAALSAATAAFAAPTKDSSSRPKALVYRGPAACDGCPESVGHLLETSASKFEIIYVGPKEKNDITKETLSNADVFAQPGGGGVSENWPHMKPYKQLIRDFISDGGVYLGFCLGAYFAGRPGYDILPNHSQTNEECTQPGAQVTNRTNTMIQVDWEFTTGPRAGKTEELWQFFQDGAVILLNGDAGTANGAQVIGRYASNGDVSAVITPFGKGWVGNTGAHVEATKDWCKLEATNILSVLDKADV